MSAQHSDLTVETRRPDDNDRRPAGRVVVAGRTPALRVRPRSPEEVAAALDDVARHQFAVSVQSGGHGPLGRPETGGMLIDLAHLDRIDVLDARRRLVRVGAGATWGRVAAALDHHGWAITSGDTADVGVGGLTLGGGFGWMVRKHGLAIDNLVGARVVTADGRLVSVSNDEHPDLFWALRGGGGNFGVVVDFDFIAQPVPTVHFGGITYRFDSPIDLLARWRDAMRCAPDELSCTLVLTRTPAGTSHTTVTFCYSGPSGMREADVDLAIDPLFALGTVVRATIAERRYGEILETAGSHPGIRPVVRNALVPALDDAVMGAIGRLASATGPAVIAVRSLGGAFGRVPTDATAFAHRDTEAMVGFMLMPPRGVSAAEIENELIPWHAVAAHGCGTYLNFQGSATEQDLAAACPPATRARLAAIKRRYDPGNTFRINHNIEPAVACDGSGRQVPNSSPRR